MYSFCNSRINVNDNCLIFFAKLIRCIAFNRYSVNLAVQIIVCFGYNHRTAGIFGRRYRIFCYIGRKCRFNRTADDGYAIDCTFLFIGNIRTRTSGRGVKLSSLACKSRDCIAVPISSESSFDVENPLAPRLYAFSVYYT